jgi:hypothetical protein
VQRLHRIGGVDDLAHFFGEGKERYNPLPVLTPKPADRRIPGLDLTGKQV